MSKPATIDQVQAELAQFPQLMALAWKNQEPYTLTVFPEHGGKEEFPAITGFFERARQDANTASRLDDEIPEVEFIHITNNAHSGSFSSYAIDGQGRTHLTIRSDALTDMREDFALALLTHEYAHYHHQEHGRLAHADNATHQLLELEADRATKNPLAMSAALMVLMTSPQFMGNYFPNNFDPEHPTLRDRIHALLEEAYGNSIFRKSGTFGPDHQFYPARQDFRPVLENGQQILNWDTELAPAIHSETEKDMHRLDRLVMNGGKKELTGEEIDQFLEYIDQNIDKFSSHHTLQVSYPSPEFLARQFEQALDDPSRREAVMAMRKGMPAAFQAYDEAVRQADYFVTGPARDMVIETARKHLIEGILKDEYPIIKHPSAELQDQALPGKAMER